MLNVLQIGLHHVTFFLLILHQVGHFQHTSIQSPDIVDARIIVLMIQRAYHLHNLRCFLILAQSSSSPLVHAGNVDDGFLMRIKHLANMVQIRAMIEVVAKNKILQILIAIQLLIIVIGYRKEPRFVLSPQNGYAITAEIRASHGYYMSCRVVHHPADHITQI